jgi:hypothetical protein
MLVGGSAAAAAAEENGGGSYSSFVYPGIRSVTASPKKTLTVRLLPAFDMSMSLSDDAFGTGWSSYRSADAPEQETGEPGFSDWFYPIMGYTYFGHGKERFISGLTGTSYYPSGKDPIRDAWKYIDGCVSDPYIKALAHGKIVQENGRDKKLPSYLQKTPRSFALLNALVQDEKVLDQWNNVVLVVTASGLKALIKDLNKLTPRSDKTVITEEWPDFYYGDITHPEYGPVVRLAEMEIDNYTTAGFHLEQVKDADRHNLKPMQVTEAQLRARYRIFDTEKVTAFRSAEEQYQTILDYLVSDGVVPMDVLRGACSRYGVINEDLRTVERRWFENQDAGDGKTVGGGRLGAPQPAAAPQPQTTSKTAEAVSALRRNAVDEDVPMESPKKPAAQDAPPVFKGEGASVANASSANGTNSAATAQARMAEFTQRIISGQTLSPEELTELSELSKTVGKS